MLTTTTCDNRYLDVMKVFLYTMNLHNKEKTFLKADLINGNDDIYKRLGRLYENMKIVHLDMQKGLDWTKNEFMIFLMRTRIPTMWKTLKEEWDQVMTIDSDIIIRKPMDSIWDGVESDVIKIWDRGPKKQPFTRVQAGVHIFGNSEDIRIYYKDFMNELGNDWEFRQGQAAIYTVYLRHKNKIRLIQMPVKYNDSDFIDNSIIWHCKHAHIDKPKFQKEFQKYLIEANKIYER